jgi:hypothetical protein
MAAEAYNFTQPLMPPSHYTHHQERNSTPTTRSTCLRVFVARSDKIPSPTPGTNIENSDVSVRKEQLYYYGEANVPKGEIDGGFRLRE